MSADDGDARLICLVDGASEDLRQDLARQSPAREPDQAERRQGHSGHGVDVAQGVRRGDRPEIIRSIDDRREKIGRHNECQVVADPINRSVVGRRVTNDHVGIGDRRQGREQREQVVRRLLGRTAGALGVLSEADRVRIKHDRYPFGGKTVRERDWTDCHLPAAVRHEQVGPNNRQPSGVCWFGSALMGMNEVAQAGLERGAIDGHNEARGVDKATGFERRRARPC